MNSCFDSGLRLMDKGQSLFSLKNRPSVVAHGTPEGPPAHSAKLSKKAPAPWFLNKMSSR